MRVGDCVRLMVSKKPYHPLKSGAVAVIEDFYDPRTVWVRFFVDRSHARLALVDDLEVCGEDAQAPTQGRDQA